MVNSAPLLSVKTSYPGRSPDHKHYFGIDNVHSCSPKKSNSGNSTQYSYIGTWYKVLANQIFSVGYSSTSSQCLLHLRHPGLPMLTHHRYKCIISLNMVTLWYSLPTHGIYIGIDAQSTQNRSWGLFIIQFNTTYATSSSHCKYLHSARKT